MSISKRLLIALPVSVVITFTLLVVYALYPIISMMLRPASQGPETSGIVTVAGGVRSATLLIVEVIVFVIVFLLLGRSKAE